MYKILVAFIMCAGLLLVLSLASLHNFVDQLYPWVARLLPLERNMIESDKYRKLLNQYEQNYSRIKQADYLFLGDSHIQYFNTATYFSNSNIINYGIAGDTTRGVLQRLPSVQTKTSIKKGVLFMVGYNDLKYKDVQEIINEHRQLITMASKQLHIPVSKIVLQSLLPVSRERTYVNGSIVRINQAAKTLCAELGCVFLDFYSFFTSPEGGLNDRYSRDGVHLNHLGYELWASLLKKSLTI